MAQPSWRFRIDQRSLEMRIVLSEIIHALPRSPRPFTLGQSVLGGSDALGGADGADGAPLLSPIVDEAARRVSGSSEIFNAESGFVQAGAGRDLTEQSPHALLPLFAYGTLRNAQFRDFLVGGEIEKSLQATARGRWQLTESGIRAAVFQEGNEEIEGDLLWFRPASYERVIRRIDDYETRSLYRHVSVHVMVGRYKVNAFAYEWTGDGTSAAGRRAGDGSTRGSSSPF